MKTLQQLAEKYDADKRVGMHGYVGAYERYLGPRRERVRRVLEFGVLHGASMYMWEEFFPRATVVGVDPEPHVREGFSSERRKLIVGRQEDPAVRDAIAREFGSFDLIVDDAGHLPAPQRAGLELYFDLVSPGGYYVIEDLHTAYWPDFTPAAATSVMDDLRCRLDDLNLRGRKEYANAPETEEFARSLSPFERDVAAVHFHRSIVFIEKRKAAE